MKFDGAAAAQAPYLAPGALLLGLLQEDAELPTWGAASGVPVPEYGKQSSTASGVPVPL